MTARALTERMVDPSQIEGLVLGWTVPQPEIFYGAPLLAARLGAAGVSGPMISPACATSVACLNAAPGAVAAGGGLQLVVATDRTSNGPQMLYPQARELSRGEGVVRIVGTGFGRVAKTRMPQAPVPAAQAALAAAGLGIGQAGSDRASTHS